MRCEKLLSALLVLAVFAGCDDAGKSDFDRERADGTYRAAMSDYQAGRLTQALAGFKKACVANPANASARFQLACLLQDSVKDYAGAFCAYREYLLQCPESDKAKLAADRLAVCEREMAKALTEKYASSAAQDAVRREQEAKAARTKSETELAKTRVALEAANRQLETLREENRRLKDFMREDAEPETAGFSRGELAAARALAAEADDSEKPVAADDVAAAKKMVERDTTEAPPLLAQDPGAKARRAAQEAERKAGERAAVPAPRETRPETYVVQEGDTLYKLAVRFYGRASAWQGIRSANRATISTDGRLRAGQKIVLPNL